MEDAPRVNAPPPAGMKRVLVIDAANVMVFHRERKKDMVSVPPIRLTTLVEPFTLTIAPKTFCEKGGGGVSKGCWIMVEH